ncbi:MAG: ThuA domain-containing protein [Pseudomonadales bacterium]|nr:ThuA domain-containing protein [Pseudomonadales bacterium]MCP5184925.1 ThuA domain-containing protein [Pseudomonadales bacterium]
MNDRIRVLVVSKGHDYNHDAFLAMLDAMPDIDATLVQQPAAQVVLQPGNVDPWDVIFFYDMSGIPGVGLLHDGANDTGIPPEPYRQAIEALLQSGKGLLLVNHATVSWPLWPVWREIHGSSFMLSQGQLDGRTVPGSGYRGGHGPLESATIRLVPQGRHPVLEGLESGLDITDELYLKTPEFEAHVLPLLRGDYDFVQANFTPPPLASAEERASWQHPPGSNLIVWANAARRCPVIVSDVGDSPLAYDSPDYRRLLNNAFRWLASHDARLWAESVSATRRR